LTFYNLSYQLIVLAILILPIIINQHFKIGVVLYLLSFIGLTRGFFVSQQDPNAGLAYYWIDMVWVLAMFLAVGWLVLEETGLLKKKIKNDTPVVVTQK
jgi:hypothetical protein